MNKSMTTYLAGLFLGEMQMFQNMAVVPLFASGNGQPEYVMLKDALAKKLITVVEIDQGGSVPELKVINHSDEFVLFLDGEELMGAKQNRVLNTSISYSNTVMSPSVRARKIGFWPRLEIGFGIWHRPRSRTFVLLITKHQLWACMSFFRTNACRRSITGFCPGFILPNSAGGGSQAVALRLCRKNLL